MQSRDVDEALARALAILQAAGAETDDEEGGELFLQDDGLANTCRNPFCSRALPNSYAQYCEGRQMCQQHRALRLQCLANAEKAAVQDIEALGRTHSFLSAQANSSVLDQASSMRQTAADHGAADETYVIPRRKCPGTDRAATVEVHSAHQSMGTHQPWRAKTRRCANAGDESRKRKRLRPARGMQFTEVLAHFEPPTTNVPASAASSPPHVSQGPMHHDIMCQDDHSRGRFAQAGNIPSHNSLRIHRRAYKPPGFDTAQTSPRTANIGADAAPVAPLSTSSTSRRSTPQPTQFVLPMQTSSGAVVPAYSPEQHTRPQHNWRFSCPEQLHLGQENRQREYRYNAAPRPLYALSPASSRHYPAHRSDIDQIASASGRREDCTVDSALTEESGRSSVYPPQVDRMTCTYNYHVTNLDTWRIDGQAPDTRSAAIPNIYTASASRRDDEPRNATVDEPSHAEPSLSGQYPNASARSDHEFTRSDTVDDDYEAAFSYHDPFLLDILSLSIRHLPTLLEPVVNVTKKPRKMQWYIDYMGKIECTCRPHLHIQMESGRAVVMVHNRVWIELKRSSTIVALREVIQYMRAEAITWNNLKSEVEYSLELYHTRQSDAVDQSNVFIRAWNNLKSRSGDVSLPRQSNYFCGSRLHHWNFVIGNVEIGSGSHNDKREAFRLAAASTAEFLLRLDDGHNEHRWRPSNSDGDSTESSDCCELMFVRSAGCGSIDAANLIMLRDSSSSTSEDAVEADSLPSIATPQNEEEDNDIEVIESKTATGGEAISGTSTSSNLVSTHAAPLDGAPPSVSIITTVIAPRPCRLCEILRMRKPDSAGCRQCQWPTQTSLLLRTEKRPT